MALKKVVKVDLIEVLENGCIQVRTKTVIMEEGQQISNAFHRHIVAPGEDYSKEDARVKSICAAIHTPEMIALYKAAQEASQAKFRV